MRSSLRWMSSNVLNYKKPIFFTPSKPPPPIPVDTEAIEKMKRSYKVWSRLLWFVCIPSIVISYYHTFYVAEPPKRLKRTDWDFCKPGSVRFPWGDGKHSPFFNKYINFTEDGYETTEEEFLEWRKRLYGR